MGVKVHCKTMDKWVYMGIWYIGSVKNITPKNKSTFYILRQNKDKL